MYPCVLGGGTFLFNLSLLFYMIMVNRIHFFPFIDYDSSNLTLFYALCSSLPPPTRTLSFSKSVI